MLSNCDWAAVSARITQVFTIRFQRVVSEMPLLVGGNASSSSELVNHEGLWGGSARHEVNTSTKPTQRDSWKDVTVPDKSVVHILRLLLINYPQIFPHYWEVGSASCWGWTLESQSCCRHWYFKWCNHDFTFVYNLNCRSNNCILFCGFWHFCSHVKTSCLRK